jgi:perosamine synthetase
MQNSKFIPWAIPDIGKSEFNEVQNIFKSNWFSQGPRVKKFEKLMSRYCNAKYAIAVSNGTLALDIAYKTCGVSYGDEVIVPAMSYFSSASMVSYQNATPVFVDIKKDTFNIDPKSVKKAISKKTKAICFIDYGGNPSEIDELKKISKKYKIPLIQDGAQSLGAKFNGKNMGCDGDMATTSFHSAKVMTTIEGGMIFTNNFKLYKEALMRRSHGERKAGDYIHQYLGTNARMTDIQAGIGIKQLEKLRSFLNKRKKIAKEYDKIFKNNSKIILPKQNKKNYNSYFFYPILIKNRDRISKILKQNFGIDTRVAYKMPIYKQKVYQSNKVKFRKLNCKNAEYVTKNILNLPIYPLLKISQVKYIAKSICDLLE